MISDLEEKTPVDIQKLAPGSYHIMASDDRGQHRFSKLTVTR